MGKRLPKKNSRSRSILMGFCPGRLEDGGRDMGMQRLSHQQGIAHFILGLPGSPSFFLWRLVVVFRL